MRNALLLSACALLSACVTEEVKQPNNTWTFDGERLPGASNSAPAPARQEADAGDKPFPFDLLTTASAKDLGDDRRSEPDGSLSSPFHRLGNDVIRGIDGSYTKLYRVRGGRSADIVQLLQAYVPDFPTAPNTPNDPNLPPTEQIRYATQPDFYRDDTTKMGQLEGNGNKAIADVLHVTAPPDVLLFIDELLNKVLGDLPQIELEVRVVEVNLDDSIEWDSKVIARRLTDPDLPFDATTNPPAGNFGAGIPILDGNTASGIGAGFSSFGSNPANLAGFLVSLQGVHSRLVVDGVISLLQTVGSAEIISSPTITVLNGHRAKLVTGDQIPVFKTSGNFNNPTVLTEFKPTGVTMDIVPFIVSDDLVRIDLSIDVSSQTGAVPYNIGGTEVSSPIISQRTAATTVHVYAGQVFALGGLRASTEIETITKVPFLGDIPILGWLFKSRLSQRRNTEILFFITPRILIPSESLLNPLEAWDRTRARR
ncbi:MAG: type II and III secretion system protein [Planctomycetes bacterium]|nr:type II and III secretion system protein [Planctomycetota bacterium]